MKTICGLDCCEKCGMLKKCGGCQKIDGHPLGGDCIAAECIKKHGCDKFNELKSTLIKEFNDLGIKGLEINDLNLLIGFYVNLEYELENGQKIKFLKDNNVYLGNQIEIVGSERCYGVIADEKFLLVCEYGYNGIDPEIVMYKRR